MEILVFHANKGKKKSKNQPPRSGNKVLYISDNQSSRPPLLQKEGKLISLGFSHIHNLKVDGYAPNPIIIGIPKGGFK